MNVADFLRNNPNILIYLLILVATPLLIAAQVWFLVRKMSEPEKMLVPLPNGLAPGRQMVVAQMQEWLNAMEMEPVFARRFGMIETVTFQQRGAPRFFSILFHKSTTFSFETYFDDTDCTCLDTGTSGSGGMFPTRLHQYQQSFPNASPDEAWQRHYDAELYLVQRFGLRYQQLTMPYEDILLKAMRLRMQHVRSIPLYPFRALYWYFVSRGQLAHRTIQQQFPPVQGMQQMPQ